MSLKSVALLGLFLALILILAGCNNNITAEEIIAKMEETIEGTHDAHAIVKASIDAQGIRMDVTAEVWEKMPNKVRTEIRQASEARYQGAVMVSDGVQAWYYEPAGNRVLVGSAGEVDMPLGQEMLGPLQERVQDVLDVSDVELVGEDAVAGHDAYKLILTPREDAEEEIFPGNGTATLWVDKQQWIILKATYEASAFGSGGIEIQDFELNPGIADDLFEFEVPEGASVVDVEAQQPEPMTLDEAGSQAGFPLLLPGYVPQDATLIEVFRVGDSFVLRYNHSTQVSFAIVQGPELPGPPPLGQSQDVSIRGQSATVVTDLSGGNTFLYWTENGVTVTIAGHISQDEAFQVAESLQ